MLTTMLLLAAQAATPASPAAEPSGKTVVREIVIHEGKDGESVLIPKGAGERHRILVLRDGERKGEARTGERREIMILRDGETRSEAKPGERREIRILRGGAGENPVRVTMLGDCKDGRKFETEAEGSKDGAKQRTRVLLCARGDKASGVSMTEALERAQKRIAEDKDMPDDVKARVLASLGAEISRLKTAD